MVGKMYPDTKTYNPFLGCHFDCVYCESSFKKVLKWIARRSKCQDCFNYTPHEHPERLKTSSIPSAKIVFVFGQGDITFCRPEYVRRTFSVIRKHKPRVPKAYYFQSKNPKCLEQYIGEYPRNSILVTTLETNRDEVYGTVSKAPVPSVRFRDFYELDFPRKVVTIEPVMDFDYEELLKWMIMLRDQGSLKYVWFGYNSNPEAVSLPEPSEEKAQRFVDSLIIAGIEVRGKSLRGVVV
jgi:hypothetical protein